MKSGSWWDVLKSRCDAIAAAMLFAATVAFVLWQHSQVAVLWDLSYLLDTSWRIALGQMPYRDFPLVHPPLTFAIQAGIMRVAGRHYLWPVLYAAVVSGLGTVIAWRVILRIVGRNRDFGWILSLLLALPLVFLGIYCIYPHPIYDCDCAFSILVAVFALQRLAGRSASESGTKGWVRASLTGLAVVLPVFFKQNIGLPFLLIIVVGILLLVALSLMRPRGAMVHPDGIPLRDLLRVLASISVWVAAALSLIQWTAGLGNYLHWTVHFAAQRRLPGFAEMLGVYRQPAFVWTLPVMAIGLILLHAKWAARVWLRVVALALVCTPFVASLLFLVRDDDLDERGDDLLSLWPLLLIAAAVTALFELRKGITLRRLLPFFVLAAIHGTFLSQQLWGSTYAIWPLLMILIAVIVGALPQTQRSASVVFASVISVTFLVCGGLYAAGHDRLNYVQMPNEPVRRSAIFALKGMSIRGPYLADFEELIGFAEKQIPTGDGILLLPGEEPFFYATGRVPQFPVQIFDRTTDPYSTAELMDEARRRGIRWVVVKTRLQSDEDPLPERDETVALIQSEFALVQKLAGYDVYRRR